MNKGEILHLFNWDRKFFPPFRKLIHDHFPGGRHRFVVYGDVDSATFAATDDTIVYPTLLRNAIPLSKAMRRADKIILHGLFNNHLLYILALQPWVLEKSCWVLWGGDLYIHEPERSGWRFHKDEWFRRFVIRRIDRIATYVKGDYDLAKKWYGAEGWYCECILYPSNVYRRSHTEVQQSSFLSIQIGNSADPGNCHFEIFERLDQHQHADFKLYVPLSYGDQRYAAEVISVGTRIFGDRFIPMTGFMSYDLYRDFWGKMDIAIFAHKRQQGMGNMISLLGLGKKVYMRSDVTSWQFFKHLGVAVFDIDQIELTRLDEHTRRVNEVNIAAYFSESKLIKQWAEIFAS